MGPSNPKTSTKGSSRDPLTTVSSSSSLLARPHTSSYHSTKRLAANRQALLAWFDTARHDRAMPWRKPFDRTRADAQLGQRAYEVMISEVMLQQTQVATVIPYFERWVAKWPTIFDLAQAAPEDVTAMWTGLGYYSRATRLLQAAQKVVAEYDGLLPRDPKILEKDVPGIGPYTAGAITSIAYGVQTPLIDGNVHRVLARLLGIYSNPTSKACTTALWEKAAELVPEDRPGDWNEALMELGARICKPTEAKCDECPVAKTCRANAEMTLATPPNSPRDIEDLCDLCVPFPSGTQVASAGGETVFPMKAVKKKAREENVAVCCVEWRVEKSEEMEPRFLVIKRPEKGLLAGLYEFPSVTLPSPTEPNTSSTSPELVSFLKTLLGSAIDLSSSSSSSSSKKQQPSTHRQLAPVPHLFSHIAMTYHVSHLIVTVPASSSEPPSVPRGVWLEGPEAVEACAMGTGGKKCWEVVCGRADAKKEKREKAEGAGGKKKKLKKKETEVDSKQRSIASFFGSKPAAVKAATNGEKEMEQVADTGAEKAAVVTSAVGEERGVKKKPKRKWAIESSEDENGDVEAIVMVDD